MYTPIDQSPPAVHHHRTEASTDRPRDAMEGRHWHTALFCCCYLPRRGDSMHACHAARGRGCVLPAMACKSQACDAMTNHICVSRALALGRWLAVAAGTDTGHADLLAAAAPSVAVAFVSGGVVAVPSICLLLL